MKRKLIEKLQRTIEIVNSSPFVSEVMVEFCVPETDILRTDTGNEKKPHIQLTYVEDDYHTYTRKISLGSTALQSTPENLAMHIIQDIVEFRDEIDDVIMG